MDAEEVHRVWRAEQATTSRGSMDVDANSYKPKGAPTVAQRSFDSNRLARSRSSASPRFTSRAGLAHRSPSINIKSSRAASHNPGGKSPSSFPKFVRAGGSHSSVAAARTHVRCSSLDSAFET